jgi:hypothetical protein
VNVSDYQMHIDHGAECLVEMAEAFQLFHLEPAQWKEERAHIDAGLKRKRDREAAQAAQRVDAAREARVNVRVEDLSRSGLDYVPLIDALARYADHIPAALKATGVGKDGAELLVCMAPAELKALQKREVALFDADRESVLAERHAEARDVINRLKKIGAREAAYLVEASLGTGSGVTLEPGEFEARGMAAPADLTRDGLAGYDPLELVKVYLWSSVLTREGSALEDALRWILNRPTLGLAHETEEGRGRILAQAASEIFPHVTTDPKTLAEWQKAAALNMPVAEIARSYHTTEADVRGALGRV